MSAVPVTGTRTTKSRSRSTHRKLTTTVTTAKITTFALIVGFTYLASSLCGQVMLEKARREGIAAGERALAARKAEAEASKHLDLVTSFAAVDQWARTHNLLSPDDLAAQPGTPTVPLTDQTKPAAGTPGDTQPSDEATPPYSAAINPEPQGVTPNSNEPQGVTPNSKQNETSTSETVAEENRLPENLSKKRSRRLHRKRSQESAKLREEGGGDGQAR